MKNGAMQRSAQAMANRHPCVLDSAGEGYGISAHHPIDRRLHCRVVVAGLREAALALGPVAAFLYVTGFLALPLIARGELAWLLIAAAVLLSFALICGGAYHAQYVYLSIIAKAGHEDLYEEVSANILTVMRLATIPLYAGFIFLGAGIVLGQTVLPAWFVVLTPVATSFLGLVWMHAPQPARCVLFGGWSNLVFTIMFASMLVAMACP